MRRYSYSLTLLISAVFIFASCLSSDDTTTLYDDAAVTAFSLTSAQMTVHTTSSSGGDSTYSTTTTMVANYPFTIDQYAGEIYNADSLPSYIDASKILSSLSTKNSGTAIIQSLERSDSASYFSSTDTIDYSEPRTLRVVSTSGTYTRTYTIKVNVHQESADSFYWSRKADNADFAAMTGMKSILYSGDVMVFGSDGYNTSIYHTSQLDGDTWDKYDLTFGADAYKNVVYANNYIYVLDGTMLIATPNGFDTYTTINSNTPVERLIGGCTGELYGLSPDNKLMMSDDGGVTWKEDSLEDDALLLPTEDLNYCYYNHVSNANTDYVLLAGNRSLTDYPNDSTAMVWCKTVEKSSGSQNNGWMHIAFDDYNYEKLHRLANLNVVGYTADYILAVGGNGVGACDKSAFSQFYISDDNGLHWSNDTTYTFPSGLIKTAGTFTVTTDDYNYIWIICGGTGQVWKGRPTKMGWAKNKEGED